jgi:ABC-type cobalamin transport system ATPase subunit
MIRGTSLCGGGGHAPHFGGKCSAKTLGRENNPIRVDFDDLDLPSPMPDGDLLALDEALQELAVADPVSAELINLRFFTGLTQAGAAHELGLSHRKAHEAWVFGRAFLYKRLHPT